MLHLDPGCQFEQFAGNVGEVSKSGGAIIQLARIGFGIGDKRRQRICRTDRIRHHHFIALDKLCNRRQSLEHIEITRMGDGGKNRERARITKQQRVAVGLSRCDGLIGNHTRGAGAVLDDDGVAQHFTKALRNDPGRYIDRPAGRIGHDRLDDPVRIGLGRTGTRSGNRDGGRHSRNDPLCHDEPQLCDVETIARKRLTASIPARRARVSALHQVPTLSSRRDRVAIA